MASKVLDSVSDGLNLVRLAVGDLHRELLLERHHYFHCVEAVKPELALERSFRSHLRRRRPPGDLLLILRLLSPPVYRGACNRALAASTFEKFFTTLMTRSVTSDLSRKVPAPKLLTAPHVTAGNPCK